LRLPAFCYHLQSYRNFHQKQRSQVGYYQSTKPLMNLEELLRLGDHQGTFCIHSFQLQVFGTIKSMLSSKLSHHKLIGIMFHLMQFFCLRHVYAKIGFEQKIIAKIACK